MKSILIDACGGDNWIGGLYYKINILFLLSQNSWLKRRYKIIVFTEEKNKNIFLRFDNCFVRTGKSANVHYKKISLFIISLIYRCKCIYPASSKIYKLINTETIQWIPDFQYIHYPEMFGVADLNTKRELHSSVADRCCKVVLSSDDCRRDFLGNYNASENNIYVVPFVSYIEPEIRELESKCENDILNNRSLNKDRYAVIMNQFWQHKNHIVVLEAMKKYYSDNPESTFKFVFTGNLKDYRNPEYIDKIKALFENPIIKEHSVFLGFIDRIEQIAIMKNAAFVIQPSMFEGWGTVVEDAKVLDKTILLSDIPVHHEQMNEKCILFDPHDPVALADLIEKETIKEHHDDVEKGIADMYRRAKEYSKGFEQLLKDLENKK